MRVKTKRCPSELSVCAFLKLRPEVRFYTSNQSHYMNMLIQLQGFDRGRLGYKWGVVLMFFLFVKIALEGAGIP